MPLSRITRAEWRAIAAALGAFLAEDLDDVLGESEAARLRPLLQSAHRKVAARCHWTDDES